MGRPSLIRSFISGLRSAPRAYFEPLAWSGGGPDSMAVLDALRRILPERIASEEFADYYELALDRISHGQRLRAMSVIARAILSTALNSITYVATGRTFRQRRRD